MTMNETHDWTKGVKQPKITLPFQVGDLVKCKEQRLVNTVGFRSVSTLLPDDYLVITKEAHIGSHSPYPLFHLYSLRLQVVVSEWIEYHTLFDLAT